MGIKIFKTLVIILLLSINLNTIQAVESSYKLYKVTDAYQINITEKFNVKFSTFNKCELFRDIIKYMTITTTLFLI